MDPTELRADIPALDGATYLNTGASGPAPARVLDAAADAQRRHEVDAHHGDPYPHAWDAYDATREPVADLLGAAPDEIALAGSTGDGISRVVNAVDWEAGDAVVRTDLEHPAGVLPFARLREMGVEVREVPAPGGYLDFDAYREAVDGVRFVCLSSLSWLHGTRLDVERAVDIAHDAGAFVLVDAVQSVGHHPVDVTRWGADAVVAAGHKWLLGVWGAGFLYVDGDVVESLRPRHVGYRGVEHPTEGFAYHPDASRFEVGTQSLAPYAALREAIAVHGELGSDAVHDRVLGLAERLADALGERLVSPAEPESGLVTFTAEEPEATVDRLAERDIHVRSLPGGEHVRASVHAFNTAEDVDRLLDAL
ncbi:aminotransferase class V-fold PLP-dependent enzyme [Halorarius halobius]|uniref:aminotransferase class V-fold PLP-dependent enzyme n=1 Tax=Halorarius halobius TaxID=2962671 RepID=UPI0020CF49C6|nr:aminotransferase class V-fold PLP-dependent enzyme [Halorarius halobius]